MAAAKPAVVGAFVLGGLALGVVAVLLFGGMQLFSTRVKAMVVFQGSVAGLVVGAPVTFRGVKVGTVQGLKVQINVPDLKPLIPVFLDLDPEQISWTNGTAETADGDLKGAVNAGLRAQLILQSLVTGQLEVDLDFHPGTPAPLVGAPDGFLEIPTIASDLQQLKDQFAQMNLPDLADKTRAALTSMQHVLTELEERIGPLADSLDQTAGSARTTLETTTAAVHQIEADTTIALKHIDQLAIASRQQVTTNGKDLDALLRSAGQTTTEAESLLASLNDMTSLRSPMRGDLEASLRDLAASAGSLRSFTHDLERNPAGTVLRRDSR
jgi:paraquat-inducible protein B